MVKWQGLLSLRGGRLDEAQTFGAGWVSCVVYGREHRTEAQAARVLQAVLSGQASENDKPGLLLLLLQCCVVGTMPLSLSEFSFIHLYQGNNYMHLLFEMRSLKKGARANNENKPLRPVLLPFFHEYLSAHSAHRMCEVLCPPLTVCTGTFGSGNCACDLIQNGLLWTACCLV